jgi:K+ transporter
MYSINVFLTFSLSMFGMARVWFTSRKQKEHWRRRFSLFAVGFLLCSTILLITVLEKFLEGGWITLLVTGSLVALCFLIRRHYRTTQRMLDKLQEEIGQVPRLLRPLEQPLDPNKPTAAVLVGNYGGLGIHTVLNIFRTFPGHFKGLVFVSVGVVDSGAFKGEEEIEALRKDTADMLHQYVELAANLGVPATARSSVGTDVVAECEQLCMEVAQEFPRATFFAGKIIFQRERWYQRLLHNETAHAIQKRLQWAGRTMVILPARVR